MEKKREKDPEREGGEGVGGRRVESAGEWREEVDVRRRGEEVDVRRRGEEVDVKRRGEEVDVKRRGEDGVGERGEGDAEERQERDAVGKWKVDSEGMDQDQYLWQENIKIYNHAEESVFRKGLETHRRRNGKGGGAGPLQHFTIETLLIFMHAAQIAVSQ